MTDEELRARADILAREFAVTPEARREIGDAMFAALVRVRDEARGDGQLAGLNGKLMSDDELARVLGLLTNSALFGKEGRAVADHIDALTARASAPDPMLVGALEVRPEVAAFARLMEAKLRENAHKGGWQHMTVGELLGRLREETDELDGLIRSVDADNRVPVVLNEVAERDVGREAADVANFAMMIADVCGSLTAYRAASPRGGAGDSDTLPSPPAEQNVDAQVLDGQADAWRTAANYLEAALRSKTKPDASDVAFMRSEADHCRMKAHAAWVVAPQTPKTAESDPSRMFSDELIASAIIDEQPPGSVEVLPVCAPTAGDVKP